MDTPKANILIVDDTPVNLHLLVRMLTHQGYNVRPAPDGRAALSSAWADPPDLILLDIKMPGMSGYQVCERLKADERTRDVPVIFTSALDEIEDKLKGFALGGVDYITKPLQVDEVLARVETHLALRAMQKQLEEKNAQLEQEIAGRVQAEEALRQYTAELETRNEELDAFAHTVAHDLKGPLGHMVGFANLLEDSPGMLSDEEQHDILHTIAQSGLKMCNIIDELLLLAGLRDMDAEIKPLDNMASIVAEVRQRLAYMIEEYQAEILLPDAWPVALGHGPWIEEVWTNYLSNALKYGGQPPRVEFGAVPPFSSPPLTGETEGEMVRFWIRDNGYGLTPEEQARLFTPFTQLDQIRAKGHGLGLSIVQRIVEKLGGKVGVESQVGQGSVFFFALPTRARIAPP